MKKLSILLGALFLMLNFPVYSQGVAINDDGTSADGSAILDVKSTDKGLLPPRMTSTEILAISNPAEGLTAYNTETHKPVYFDGSRWLYYDGSIILSIGNYGYGGVIFYLDGTGGGMVCAVSDQSIGAEWGCHGTEISGADGTAIGTGAQNTIDIEAGCTTPGTAADICANLSLNGFTDWFLPSKDELNAIYQNKAAIDAIAIINGGTAFSNASYWSSTEYSSTYAWSQSFFSGYQNDHGTKNNLISLRAVRTF